MKTITKMLALAGFAAMMTLGASNALAQRDFSQMRQDRIDRYKEKMAVTDDAEWKVIETSINKVMDAEMDVMAARFSGGFGRGGRGGNRGGGGTGGTSGSTSNAAQDQNAQGRQRGGRGGFGTPSPEAEALQKAIDDKASDDVINTKLKALRDSNKAKEDKLDQAQADLRKLLTPKQEAVAVLGGLLK